MIVMLLSIVVVVIVSTVFESCVARKSEPITGETFVIPNEAVANGEKVFMVHCQKCHPAGEAGLGPAINSNPAPGFIKRFQVRHGLGVMPSFKRGEISEKDLHDIMAYLKAWKHYK
jgi:mono/diheme cytochrome c family protein